MVVRSLSGANPCTRSNHFSIAKCFIGSALLGAPRTLQRHIRVECACPQKNIEATNFLLFPRRRVPQLLCCQWLRTIPFFGYQVTGAENSRSVGTAPRNKGADAPLGRPISLCAAP